MDKFNPFNVELPSPTKERVANGACRLIETGSGNVPVGTTGIINIGYYKGLKGRLLYAAVDGNTFFQVINVQEGVDNGVVMCYQIGNDKAII